MDRTVTELLKALELGLQMRALQKSYFKTRSYVDLRDAQAAERAFDKAAQAALDSVTNEVTQGNLLP